MKVKFLLLFSVLFYSLQAQITNQEIWGFKFYPNSINGIESMQDGNHYTTLSEAGVEQFSYKTQKKVSTIKSGTFSDYHFSDDENFLLLETNSTPIFRHSKTGVWKVFEAKTKKEISIFSGKPIQQPTFSPDNSKVAFVYENNLYYQDLRTLQTIQITTDGKKDEIINGVCDWVYEEEFGFVRHFDWNATGTHIAYVKFNETDVPKIDINTYNNQLYPQNLRFKYPKAGEKNSTVSVNIFDLVKNKTQQILKSDEGNNYYIPKIKFNHNPNQLFIVSSNRHQNNVHVNAYNLKNGKTSLILNETDKAWIDTDKIAIDFLPNNSFIWKSERSGYRHLYLYSADGKKVTPLTKGNFEVTEFYGINEKTNHFYYQATDLSGRNNLVYQSNLNNLSPKLLTSNLGDNSAAFSKDFSRFINKQSTLNSPPKFTLISNGKESVLEDNQRVRSLMKEEKVSEVELLEIPNAKGQKMNAWMIKPIDYSSAKTYPVLMYVYGGPGSQTTLNSWETFNYWWFQSLAQKGYIVVSVDGRGTGGKGSAYKKSTYKNLGKYEIEDQIYAAKWLVKQGIADKERIGMFGWSFGGYMTSLALTKGADTFKTGVAVAPVTNWRYYDTVYTERFMQTPQENPSGYDDNSPINYVEKLKGNYLIIHGTADDNVHFQNTVEMTEALIQQGKDFDMMIYPDKNHGIYGGKTRLQLYNKMTKYLVNNL